MPSWQIVGSDHFTEKVEERMGVMPREETMISTGRLVVGFISADFMAEISRISPWIIFKFGYAVLSENRESLEGVRHKMLI